MDERSSKRKRGIRDVSHLFLSSLEDEQPAVVVPQAGEPALPYEAHRFQPQVKVVSLYPVNQAAHSLYLHAAFASLYMQAGYTIYIVSTHPQQESWDIIQRHFKLPPFVNVDCTSGIRTFKLFARCDLLIIPPDQLVDFMTFKHTAVGASSLGMHDGERVLFLLDSGACDTSMCEHIMPLLDSLLIVAAPCIEEMRSAYKIIKAQADMYPQLQFQLILRGCPEATIEQLIRVELNRMTEQFLSVPTGCLGWCNLEACLHSLNQYRNGVLDIFSIDPSFLDAVSKKNWSAEVLSLYQTVISHATM